ncbi:hypothetical protein C8R45DRAFT_1107975 [Mycena sanguinolenta]|nr:hypothetical protein C8R45DRAFT_1107975 [Mycena sanguinolenta]
MRPPSHSVTASPATSSFLVHIPRLLQAQHRDSCCLPARRHPMGIARSALSHARRLLVVSVRRSFYTHHHLCRCTTRDLGALHSRYDSAYPISTSFRRHSDHTYRDRDRRALHPTVAGHTQARTPVTVIASACATPALRPVPDLDLAASSFKQDT